MVSIAAQVIFGDYNGRDSAVVSFTIQKRSPRRYNNSGEKEKKSVGYNQCHVKHGRFSRREREGVCVMQSKQASKQPSSGRWRSFCLFFSLFRQRSQHHVHDHGAGRKKMRSNLSTRRAGRRASLLLLLGKRRVPHGQIVLVAAVDSIGVCCTAGWGACSGCRGRLALGCSLTVRWLSLRL